MANRVSVILPTFNRVDLIGETLDSLLAQSRPADEILVVDDGSQDGTGEVAESYGEAVTLLRKPNGGKASALNVGMAAVSGDLIWICDDDDLLMPDACERLAGTLDGDETIGFCAGRHDDFTVDPETGEKNVKAPGYWRGSAPDEIFSDLLDGCHIFQPGLIVRRAVYDRLGPFDETLTRSQDYEMMLRIARTTPGRLLPETVYLHREHAGARGSANERFCAARLNEKWIKFHRLILEPLMRDLADEELLPASVWNDPGRAATRVRTAQLKRASVYARHQLWPEALAAWHRAAEQFEGPLDAYERDIVRAATLYSFGCAPLFDDDAIRAGVLALKGRSPLGREIAGLLGRSVLWRVRAALQAGAPVRAAQIGGFVAQARL